MGCRDAPDRTLNYLLAISPCTFSKSDSWGYSIVVGLKDASRYTRLLGLQEFHVSRAAPVISSENTPTKLSNICLLLFDLYDILNEQLLLCAWRKSVLAERLPYDDSMSESWLAMP